MRSALSVLGTAVIGILSILVFSAFAPPSGINKSKPKTSQVERGKYLVNIAGCNDCHSPKVFTPMGPVPDDTKLLSGHPANAQLPEVPKGAIGPNAWGALTSNDFTAWAGPWGMSFTRNLTPDTATGIGSWTEDVFIKAIRTGKDMGEGRDILPPMPWQAYRELSDNDLKAIFAYLKSLPPIENAVPDPISPTGDRISTKTQPKK